MWPEVAQARQENRHELVLTGPAVDSYIEESEGLDPEIFKLNQLNYLKVSCTSLTQISDSIGCLDNLTNLVLQSNQLGSLPHSMEKLVKLKLLDISQNKLEMLPDALGKLPNMTTLNARNNDLSNIGDLKDCSQLAHLDVRNNKLEIFPEICSENHGLLADVLLSGNKIPAIPINISELLSLKLLDLTDNLIKEVPGEIMDCQKLKELQLKGNQLTDKRLKKLVENDRTLPRQVLDYVRQHCPKQSGGTGGGKGKKGKKGKASNQQEEVDSLCDQLHVMRVTDTLPNIQMSENVKDVRPYIVCCVLRSLDLTGDKLRQFLSIQTNLHEGICEKRLQATIATHDMAKIGNALRYCARPPAEIRIHPLGYAKEFTARNFLLKLQKDADNQRKQQKRNNVSGIHKYLHLLDGKENWPCLVDVDGSVISLHPITNGDKTKISADTKDIFAEVTSATSLNKAKEVMEALVLSILQIGATSEATESGRALVRVQQAKVTNEDGGVRVLYPSRTDLNIQNSRIQVLMIDKE